MNIPSNISNSLAKQSIVIFGFGKEGQASYHFLRQILPNKKITIADQQTLNQFSEKIQTKFSQDKFLELNLGQHHLNNLNQFSLIIKSPGIPGSLPAIQTALQAGSKLSSNTQLLFEIINSQPKPNLSIGITGTKGKSTTSSMIYHVLQTLGIDSVLIGNIGQAPLANLDQIKEKTLIILELSCHQLAELTYSPDIAVIQNITSEHLDYYPDTASYIMAKSSITKYQKINNFVIYNPNFSNAKKIADLSQGSHLWHNLGQLENRKKQLYSNILLYIKDNYLTLNSTLIDKINLNTIKCWKIKQNNEQKGLKQNSTSTKTEETIIDIAELPLLGKHNLYNIMPAVIIAKMLEANTAKIAQALRTFQPLPHRLELATKINGVNYINDSMATMPDAAVSALKAFKQPIILLAGGHERNQNFNELANTILTQKVKALILFPSTGERLKKMVLEQAERQQIHAPECFLVESMADAMKIAKKIANSGDVVLLSPGSASFGVFKNYADRGEQFRRTANQ